MYTENHIQALATAILNNTDSQAKFVLSTGKEVSLPTTQRSGTIQQAKTYADIKAREVYANA